ncbi:MAG TPA: GxxExxY protein [Chthoniobacter sp.]|jgi:GxxExxY protein
MKHEKITKAIIGAAMKVHSRLRPGLDECFYEKALVIELAGMGLSFENQREFPVYYEGHFLGKLVPDLIVENAVIADTKVVTAFNDEHISQMIGYLNVTGLEVALLLNFKHASLQWKRVVVGVDPAPDSTPSDLSA